MLLALAAGGFFNMAEVGGQTAAQSIQKGQAKPTKIGIIVEGAMQATIELRGSG
ncbi:hypothetical protein HMPREF9946_00922 [Acetobacteraceae bacterium AT-5844]|nr:hypothetical protein HMPREF9946_00922 [Acetobacteraceae bacterium AT-5844]